MKRNISDLLDFYVNDGVDLETDTPLSPDRIRRLTMERIHTKRKPLRRGVLFAAVVAALLAAAVSAGAAYLVSRARTLEAELHMTAEQRQQAEESGLSSCPNDAPAPEEVTSVTDNGVTITAERAIVDSYFAMLSFRVEGVTLPAGSDPFASPGLTVDDKNVSWSGSFYDGILSENGMAASYDDGSPLEYGANGGLLRRYVADDGSLTYHMFVIGESAGALIGGRAKVSFADFGYLNDNEPSALKTGTWRLNWTLKGSDEIRTAYPEQPIGDTGAVLAEVEISPISLRAVLRISDELEQARLAAVDDDEAVPRLLGVRTKDGTLHPYLYMGPGSSHIPGANLYETRFCVNHILSPENVDAFLFLKSYPEGKETLSADNLYIVALDG